jgi:hypothetical protein
MRRARLEAIKHSCPAIVRMVDAVGREPARLEAFADCTSPQDYEPDADRPIVGTVHLPRGITFKAPPALLGKSSISGLSENKADSTVAKMAIFQQDGSIDETGAFRLGDEVGNFLEVRVEPKATARIEVRKCLACTNEADDKDWYADGNGGKAWAWK